MIKKTITFEDFNGNPQTEDYYFNLSKLEIVEMELKFPEGLEGYIQKITETESGVEAYKLFKEIILSSYGVKSQDGKRFEKSEELRLSFEQSPALAELIFEFLSNADAGAEFVKGILPAALVAEAQKELDGKKTEDVQLPSETKKIDSYSKDELLAMSDEEFNSLAGEDPLQMSRETLMIAMERRNKQ